MKFECDKHFLTAGGDSVKFVSKQSETARPQGDQYCHRHLSSNGVMDARGDDDDTEMNCEEDDGDVEDGETGFDDGSSRVRSVRDPGQPTVDELREHITTHQRFRSWCQFCVIERE